MTPFLTSVIKDNIFYISSENYEKVNSAFYGYAYDGKNFMLRMKPDGYQVNKWSSGCWIDISVSDKHIIIQQDYFCMFDIYVYISGNFWAISNSLYYMTISLPNSAILTVNHDFECLLLRYGQINSVTETIFNEITELMPDERIVIEKNSGEIHIIYERRSTYDIDPFSSDGVALIDRWRDRWYNLYSTLISDGFSFVADITGGMDSRLAMVCSHNLDFNSKHTTLYTADSFNKEDLPLAKQICELLGLPLSQSLPEKEYKISGEEQLFISLLFKFCHHDQFCAPKGWSGKPIFRRTGAAGMRGQGTSDSSEILEMLLRIPPLGGIELATPVHAIMMRTLKKIEERFPQDISDSQKLYNCCRIKCHAGKTALEGFVMNEIAISPFFDPMLYRLALTRSKVCDVEIFTAFALTRWLPQLKRMPFDRNRMIAESTWLQAEGLNARYPYSPPHTIDSVGILIKESAAPAYSQPTDNSTMHLHMAERYRTSEMRAFVTRQFSREVYDWGANFDDHNPVFGSLKGVFGNTAITRLYMLYEAYSKAGLIFQESTGYLPEGIAPDFIKSLNTVRINCVPIDSESGDIEMIETDDPDFIYFYTPWNIKGYGTGIIAHAFKRRLVCTFGIHNSRRIRMSMSGPSRILRSFVAGGSPRFSIDFNEIIISSKISGNQLYQGRGIYACTYDKPFLVDIDVQPEDEIIIALRYEPHSYSKDEFQTLINAAYNI